MKLGYCILLFVAMALVVSCTAPTPAPPSTPTPTPPAPPPSPTTTLEDKGRDMAAVAQAKEDIEKYRKGDVTLTILDARSQPRSGVSVDYTQTGHAFLFAFHNPEDEDASTIIPFVKEIGLNSAFHMMVWMAMEPRRGMYHFDEWDNRLEVQHFHQAGFVGMGHSLIYFASHVPEWCLIPVHARSLPFEELKEAVYQYVHKTVKYYKNEIKIWNVINEPMVLDRNALGLSEQQIIEVTKEGIRAIRDTDPEAQIMINFWPPGGENVGGRDKGMHPYDFLKDAIDADADFDIIGIEWYYNAYGAPYWGGGPFPRRSLASIGEIIDLYSMLGKKVFVTEIAVPSEDIGQGYWGLPWSEELQAEYLQAAYTIFFSKPQVMGICWWNVIDRGAFIYHGGLLDEQDQPKKAYYALKDLIKGWTTTGTGVTDEKGQISFRGFGGTYEVVVTDPKTGLSKKQEVTVEEQKNNVITIVLDYG